MAFVNERIPEADRKELCLKAHNWTIDHEKDIFLVIENISAMDSFKEFALHFSTGICRFYTSYKRHSIKDKELQILYKIERSYIPSSINKKSKEIIDIFDAAIRIHGNTANPCPKFPIVGLITNIKEFN